MNLIPNSVISFDYPIISLNPFTVTHQNRIAVVISCTPTMIMLSFIPSSAADNNYVPIHFLKNIVTLYDSVEQYLLANKEPL